MVFATARKGESMAFYKIFVLKYSHLETPSVNLPIETFKFFMLKLLLAYHPDQQFLVPYLPRPPMWHPRNDMLVVGPRQNVMQLPWKIVHWAVIPVRIACIGDSIGRIVSVGMVDESGFDYSLFSRWRGWHGTASVVIRRLTHFFILKASTFVVPLQEQTLIKDIRWYPQIARNAFLYVSVSVVCVCMCLLDFSQLLSHPIRPE